MLTVCTERRTALPLPRGNGFLCLLNLMKKEYSDLFEAVNAQKNFKAVIFDMDGLVFDTERVFMEQLAVAMKEKGYSLSREVYIKTTGTTGSTLKNIMLANYGDDYPLEECSHVAQSRLEIIAETVGLNIKPQIQELLEMLKEKNIPCAVASSTKSVYIKKYLGQSGLLEYFSEIIGGEMVLHSKPEPDIFLMACEKLKTAPSAALVLEDSENGVKAAYTAGIPVICIPDLKEPDKDILKMAAAVVRKA
ncbi:MAG TPA: HAD family phosphatase [Lachnospiraceae bacterium]|nr:HAD family phosphatase [Lachnospiraceae bacterium]